MINRVLIRTKVVQLLYSYLLVENSFNLESQPAQPTREKRFSYSLYLDMLYLMSEIADGITRRGGGKPLLETRFVGRVLADDRLKSMRHKYSAGGFPFESVAKELAEVVKNSGLYKTYIKNEDAGVPVGEKIWQEIFNLLIMPNPKVNSIISTLDNYSLSGVDRMRELMDRTFCNFYAAADNLPEALKTLRMSMDKARELYFRLLDLPLRLTAMRARDIEEASRKFVRREEDRNPNMRFVENEYVAMLGSVDAVQAGIEKFGRDMTLDDDTILRSLLKAIMASDIYKDYMSFPVTDLNTDAEFWRNIYKNVIFVNPDFLEAMEDKSVFWNDDIDTIGTFVIKTAKRIADGKGDEAVLPMYKDEEDARFGKELFELVVKHKVELRQYVDDALDKSLWESDRLAFIDVVVLMTALAEIMNFPKIPLSVSLFEYIEIAKAYSTTKSGQFVHGLLSGIVSKLQKEGKLFKV